MPFREYQTYPSGIEVARAGIIKRSLKLLLRLVFLLLLLFMLILLVFRWVPIPTSAFIYTQNSLAKNAPKTYQPASYTWVDWDEISPNLAMAVIAAEDQRFADHWGVDIIEIKSAIEQSLLKGETLRGASTITQQVAKNLFLWNDRSYSRKILEIGISFALEIMWSKQRILEVYLNIAQFGDAIFGAQEASLQLFHKKPADLTIQEAAMLASVLPRPATSDVNNPPRLQQRKQQWVIKQIKQLGGNQYLKKL